MIALTLFHSLVQGPALSRLREQALERPDDAELAALIRRKAAQAGIVSGLSCSHAGDPGAGGPAGHGLIRRRYGTRASPDT